MRLQSLNHLIDLVRAVAKPGRVSILGSSSLLPNHPDLGEPGHPLELTVDADFLIEPVNEAIAESIQLAAGRDSAFMAQFGYYADILRPVIGETLPQGWEQRLQPVAGYDNVFALDPYDLSMRSCQKSKVRREGGKSPQARQGVFCNRCSGVLDNP